MDDEAITDICNSCDRLRIRLICICRLFCIRIHKSLVLLLATYGVPLPPAHTRLLTQTCA
jgi:hypothetical protein